MMNEWTTVLLSLTWFWLRARCWTQINTDARPHRKTTPLQHRRVSCCRHSRHRHEASSDGVSARHSCGLANVNQHFFTHEKKKRRSWDPKWTLSCTFTWTSEWTSLQSERRLLAQHGCATKTPNGQRKYLVQQHRNTAGSHAHSHVRVHVWMCVWVH